MGVFVYGMRVWGKNKQMRHGYDGDRWRTVSSRKPSGVTMVGAGDRVPQRMHRAGAAATTTRVRR